MLSHVYFLHKFFPSSDSCFFNSLVYSWFVYFSLSLSLSLSLSVLIFFWLPYLVYILLLFLSLFDATSL
jgi:hypothetical protein